MAVTGAIFKALTFNGESSRNYGVYITGSAVYNAPNRDVEMITIPGRNGSFPLDHGRFENIEVTYPAGIFGDDEEDFADAVSNFRNMLCSANGYCRLEDEYNPDEYRMAVYKSGLEVDPTLLKAGEFEITFECKPQRYLKSGEEPVTMGDWTDVETHTGNPIILDAGDPAKEVKNLDVELTPIQAGSGTPSPQNVRPITGHDSVTVGDTGKNIWHTDFTNSGDGLTKRDGEMDVNRAAQVSTTYLLGGSSAFIGYVLKAGTYTLSAHSSDFSGIYVTLSDGTTWANGVTQTFTSDVTINNVRCATKQLAAGTYTLYWQLQIEHGSTATDYESYHGQSKTVTLPHTVYGGKPNITTGNGKETWNKIVLNGSEAWRGYFGTGVNQMYWTKDDAKTSAGGIITTVCDSYESISIDNRQNHYNTCYTGSGSICFNIENVTVAEWKAMLQANPITVCYKLADALDLSTTPTDITLYNGDNVVSSDGDMTLEIGNLISGVDNPTRFEASPELQIKGYGTVAFNGYEIDIANQSYGDVVLIDNAVKPYGWSFELGSDDYAINNDAITVSANMPVFFRAGRSGSTFKSGTIHTSPSKGTPNFTIIDSLDSKIEVNDVAFTFSKGASNTESVTVAYDIKINAAGTESTHTTTVVYSASYNASADTIELTFTTSVSPTTIYFYPNRSASRPTISASVYGSKSVLGDPTIIDCENGEVYKEESDKIVPLNPYIDLGAELPKLATGENPVTTTGSITECVIIPRWWKL